MARRWKFFWLLIVVVAYFVGIILITLTKHKDVGAWVGATPLVITILILVVALLKIYYNHPDA